MNKNKMHVGACAPKSAHTSKARQNKGITLIALIITIIVMLILVAVTITTAINGGLFEKAGEAVGDMQNAINAEQQLADGRIKVGDKWYASIDDYLAGKVELPEGIKVGDYVNYTPDTGTYKVADGANGSGIDTTEKGYQEFTTGSNLQWRVWSIDEETGEVEIVLTTTGPSLTLKGADGYNHAVDILNDLCETLYSKTENGRKVATGRSINVEDINSKTTYSPIGETNTNTGFTYKDPKRLSEYGTNNMKYPSLYSQEIGYGTGGTINTTGLDGETGLKNGTTENGLTTYPAMGYTDGNKVGTDPYVTHTYYGSNGRYYPGNCLDPSLGINTAPKNLIVLESKTSYWLASRCVSAWVDCAGFNLFYLESSACVKFNHLFYTHAYEAQSSSAVRPIVSLGSDALLTIDDENTTETCWNIKF